MSCERFDAEFAERLELGEPVDPHVASCADCSRAYAAHQRIVRSLRDAGAATPREGWESSVFAEIDRPQRPRYRWAGAAVAACLAAGALLTLRPQAKESNDASVITELIAGHGQSLRGAGAQPGDKLRVRASTGGAPYAELRVYREDRELLLRCPGPGCSSDGRQLSGELVLPSAGAYQAVLATSTSAPLPSPSGTFAEDSRRLVAAGARVQLAPVVRVY